MEREVGCQSLNGNAGVVCDRAVAVRGLRSRPDRRALLWSEKLLRRCAMKLSSVVEVSCTMHAMLSLLYCEIN